MVRSEEGYADEEQEERPILPDLWENRHLLRHRRLSFCAEDELWLFELAI